MMDDFLGEYLTDIRIRLEELKSLAEAAMAQIDDAALFTTLDVESNSIAVLLKHLSGNMRARWQQFPEDGESERPARNRDAEFELDRRDTKQVLVENWESAWQCTFDALERLTDDDMGKTVTLRGESLSVVAAINRQYSHYAYHVGQIVFLAKHLCSGQWRSLSIPRGQSRYFDADVRGGKR